jgi:mono/diheme cytochrome c family protein
MKVYFKSLAVIGIFILLGGGLFLYSGIYPMGADSRHKALTYWLLETLRERSIARAANDIKVPGNINSPDRLLAGGADYNAMCAGCHLQPGITENDFTLGLYPAPPSLTQAANEHDHVHASTAGDENSSLKRQFWIIKHGIKASGMPAWGPGHDDERIWNMVAFLQRLPELTAVQYQILTATARNNSSGEHEH